MEKQFIYRNSKEKTTQVVGLGVVGFLVLSSLVLFVFKLIGLDPAIMAFVNVAVLITISLYVLSKIRPTHSLDVFLDSQEGMIEVGRKQIKRGDIKNIFILKYGGKSDRHVFRIGGLEIDTLNYPDAHRLNTLLPKAFPDAQIDVRKTKNIFTSLVFIGLCVSLLLFILYWVI
ncbi:MAG TPA: hypothetical protein PKV16_06190 [Caldisericia bacterium]|nr:hypothetical protein [Caldisericia bacterium]HPF49221.1 hypothetical protein [Caldisericia bacterium]HPI84099.1 hypothetical protein [Caldisericia bacterium]HPQ93357.1 hypothetical protein [Caldisericia bacterium]HRV75261.1 hypothetical protein [Caldisericia bacterium]